VDRVIIGIHGLRNKPPAQLLKDWWILSIRDGFDALKKPQPAFHFELLYWADLLYNEPSDPYLLDKKDPLYLKSPYKKLDVQSSPRINLNRQRRLGRLEQISDQLFHSDRILTSFEGIADQFIHSRFHDLEVYLRSGTGYKEAQNRPIRDVILERLAAMLKKYRTKKIMLISHSMGSIVAYDLLSQPDFPYKIDTLITIGSPLGQPTIMSKFTSENPVTHKIKVPDNLKQWINLSDLNDFVALDPTLENDFAPSNWGVSPVDIIIQNTYNWDGVANPHSAFGYLQSAECASTIYDFLTKRRTSISMALNYFNQSIRDHVFGENKRRRTRAISRPEKTSIAIEKE
jgi:pimeloyl-ACP methyl ester carboxylesterase